MERDEIFRHEAILLTVFLTALDFAAAPAYILLGGLGLASAKPWFSQLRPHASSP